MNYPELVPYLLDKMMMLLAQESAFSIMGNWSCFIILIVLLFLELLLLSYTVKVFEICIH